MFSTHVRAVRDLRNNHPEVSAIIKQRNNVIITNNGKSEAVLIPFEDFADYEEYLHMRYVKEKLAEAEVLANDPNNWTDIEDFFKKLDERDRAKA